MNPWAVLIILLGLVLVIVGIKGTQHNITSAITGKQHQPVKPTASSHQPNTSSTPTTPNPQPNPSPTPPA